MSTRAPSPTIHPRRSETLLAVAAALLMLLPAVRAQIFEAENQDASYGIAKRVVDPTASGGVAVECDQGVHPANQFVFATPYPPLDPGRYRATWRLRTPDNTRNAPLIKLDLTQPGELPYIMHVVTLKGTDFAQPNQWQDFTYDFERLEQGRVQYRGYYLGGGDIVVDRLEVVKVGDFTEQELYDRVVKQYPLAVPADSQAVWRALRNPTLEILELRGAPWEELWQTEAAVKALAPAACDVKTWTHVWHHELEVGTYFPADYQGLFKYDAVLMTDGDGRRLQATGRRMLRDYVQCGGGLVMLGGYDSYGKGRAKGSWLEEVMPVSFGTRWDLRPAEEKRLTGVETGVPECLLFLPAWQPQVLWLHESTPKPGATVAWSAGQRPAVVFGKYGEGWVVAVLAAPLGKPPAGESLFCQTEQWPQILAATLAWVATPGWKGWQ